MRLGQDGWSEQESSKPLAFLGGQVSSVVSQCDTEAYGEFDHMYFLFLTARDVKELVEGLEELATCASNFLWHILMFGGQGWLLHSPMYITHPSFGFYTIH
jgi:hypothetical protein